MSFLHDDEFIILQILMPFMADYMKDLYVYTVDDRKKFLDVGVQTAIEYMDWSRVNPKDGVYDFSSIQHIIDVNRAGGLKTVIMAGGWLLPSWIPKDWYAKHPDGKVEIESLSLWNEEAQAYSDDFYVRLLNEFYANDVMFIWAEFQGGEGIYQASSCLYDKAALEDYKATYGSSAIPDLKTQETLDWYGKKIISHSVRKQRLFYAQHREIWNSQQYLMDVWSKAFGNFVIPETFDAFRKAFPDGDLVFSQFTYFDPAHNEIPNEAFVDNIKNTYNAKVLVEAHYAQNLHWTAPKAIAKGFRGQICGPVHHQSGYDKSLEQWMLDAIGKAHMLWKASRG